MNKKPKQILTIVLIVAAGIYFAINAKEQMNKNEIEAVCKNCKSTNVRRTNPSFAVLLYFFSLKLFNHVNFHCFDCGNEWTANYFKIKTTK